MGYMKKLIIIEDWEETLEDLKEFKNANKLPDEKWYLLEEKNLDLLKKLEGHEI